MFSILQPKRKHNNTSMLGLGATLINDNKIVAFALRYTNIDWQWYLVAIDSTHVYEKEFRIESDHKPLENIQNQNIAQAPPRLQRMLLRLQPYDAQIMYRPGIEMKIPDYLLRTCKKLPKTMRN